MKNEIKLPAIDLSFNDKKWINMGGLFIEDDIYLYFNSNKRFKKNFLNHILLDSKGDMYEIIGKENLSVWRKFIPFINIKKSRLVFKFLKSKMNLKDVKEYYVKKIREWDDSTDEEYHLFIENLVSKSNKCNTLKEFFNETT